MGDAYTGSGQMEIDREERRKAYEKEENIKAKMEKAGFLEIYDNFEKLYYELQRQINEAIKSHKEQMLKISDKSFKILKLKNQLLKKFE